ncbi:UBE2D4 [Ecytonucleospora hepatopenaei]|uniref:E2 ubiquitin-conjugating enzyme n=1 Tax=Ecytonucleospora hepatopenaei TaxID=646526 RepID=A0A1W0E5U0_9MICR|nr:UBE2D4 [Ecytonucleospora hepatopenaei]
MSVLKNGCIKRLMKEVETMEKSKEENISAAPIDPSNLYKWYGIIIGPKDTPYEGGVFKLNITFPTDYPFKPPKIEFCTKIFHCNVHGKHLCLDILKNQWSPALTIDKVLISISSLMNEPNPSDPLNRDAAEKFLNCREEHNAIAREWTLKYAVDDSTTEEVDLKK